MRKVLLLIIAAVAGGYQLAAQTYTDKTAMRSPVIKGHCPLAEYSAQRSRRGHDDSAASKVNAHLFYQQSNDSTSLGRYFGIHRLNRITIGTGNSYMFSARNLVHSPTLDTADVGLKGDLLLRPRRTVWGCNLGWDQSLHTLYEGLFASINVPLAQVTHDVRAAVEDETLNPATGKGVLDYFTGNITQPAGVNQQAALTTGKLGGKRSKTAIAGIDLNVGYHLVDADDHGLRLRALLHIPTGNKTTTEFVFAPVVGNGRHVEIGCGADSVMQLMERDRFSLDLYSSLELRYVLPAHEQRLVGAAGANVRVFPWSQYNLMGQQGELGVFPAANVLPHDVNVKPGFKGEASVKLQADWSWVTLGLGYDLRMNQSEKVAIRSTWSDSTYAFAASDYEANADFDATADGNSPLLSSFYLTPDVAVTPAQLTHKIALSCSFKPLTEAVGLTLGIYGGYEFAADNAAIESFDVALTVGLAF